MRFRQPRFDCPQNLGKYREKRKEMKNHKNRSAALRFLKAEGHKVSKTKFYRDVDAGACVLQPDGSILATSLERYLSVSRLTQPAVETQRAAAGLDCRVDEEIRNLKLKNEKLTHELQVIRKKFIPRAEADSYAVDLAAVMDALARTALRMNASRYLAQIGADPERARELFDLYDADYTEMVNKVCDQDSVLLVGGDDSGVWDDSGGWRQGDDTPDDAA